MDIVFGKALSTVRLKKHRLRLEFVFDRDGLSVVSNSFLNCCSQGKSLRFSGYLIAYTLIGMIQTTYPLIFASSALLLNFVVWLVQPQFKRGF